MTIYLGMFLIAMATLGLEITLTRLLSVTTWYHLAFFAVSIAMLGMTAGGVTVFVRPGWFTEAKLRRSAARASISFAAAVPLSLVLLCVIPIGVTGSAGSYAYLMLASLVSLLPFYFVGIVISAVITRSRLPIAKLYASDLTGAALGCIFVLGGLEVFSAPALILLCGCVGIAAATAFSVQAPGSGSGLTAGSGSGFSQRSGSGSGPGPRLRAWGLAVLGVLVFLVVLDLATPYGIRPLVVKGKRADREKYVYEDWNSFSMVAVQGLRHSRPQYWGKSNAAPNVEVYQHRMKIDGSAGTVMRRFNSMDDIDHLRYDVTNFVHHICPPGSLLVVGVGGGRDIQAGVLFGYKRIVGVDINPIFIDLLEHRFREFAGVADRPEVRLVADEARSYISRSDRKFSVIQMSLTDTWAATGAGAFALSENTLYTIEAWKVFLNHLSDHGLFTVSRWHNPRELGETGRLISLAVATLLEMGIAEPADHLALVSSGAVGSLVVGVEPLSQDLVSRIGQVSRELRYQIVFAPGRPPLNPTLSRILRASSMEDLEAIAAGAPLNYLPPTDDSPYFFNMLKPRQVIPAFVSDVNLEEGSLRSIVDGVSYGSMVATRTLLWLIIALGVLAVVTVVLPLALARSGGRLPDRSGILWPAAAYFSLLGAGFMFAEIALIQRLAVFLGHPIYALGVLLFTVIASAGLGSLASGRLPLTRRPWIYVYPIGIAAAILAVRMVLPVLGSNMISSPMSAKILASILTISPLGFLLGFGFPTGMRLVRESRSAETPWYWALNGIFGVLCSAMTVGVSIYFGIPASLYVATGCYLLLLLCLPGMTRSLERAPVVRGRGGEVSN